MPLMWHALGTDWARALSDLPRSLHRRGGLYFEAPDLLGSDPYSEQRYVQDNADMGELAEDEGPDVPALVYIEATKRPDELLKEFSDAAALLLLRRLVRETHRVSTHHPV